MNYNTYVEVFLNGNRYAAETILGMYRVVTTDGDVVTVTPGLGENLNTTEWLL